MPRITIPRTTTDVLRAPISRHIGLRKHLSGLANIQGRDKAWDYIAQTTNINLKEILIEIAETRGE